jgi:hypothetical protein
MQCFEVIQTTDKTMEEIKITDEYVLGNINKNEIKTKVSDINIELYFNNPISSNEPNFKKHDLRLFKIKGVDDCNSTKEMIIKDIIKYVDSEHNLYKEKQELELEEQKKLEELLLGVKISLSEISIPQFSIIKENYAKGVKDLKEGFLIGSFMLLKKTKNTETHDPEIYSNVSDYYRKSIGYFKIENDTVNFPNFDKRDFNLMMQNNVFDTYEYKVYPIKNNIIQPHDNETVSGGRLKTTKRRKNKSRKNKSRKSKRRSR